MTIRRPAAMLVGALALAASSCDGSATSEPTTATTSAPTTATTSAPTAATTTAGNATAGTEVPPTDVWGDEIWFGGTITREAFLAGELAGLLGVPGRPVVPVGPLRELGLGRYEFVNGVGETVPVLVRAPGGGPATGDPRDWDVGRGVVVALHQTNLEGPAEPCRADASTPLAYGTAYASAGYLVVCPNLSFTGARQPSAQWDTAAFYAQYPTWTAMGKDVAEASWTIDALAASGVEAATVTMTGHSQGAVYALYAAALDPRITVVVANAGYVDTPTDPEPERWSRESWYRGFAAPPDGLDMLEVVAAIAPRCALLVSYAEDTILDATAPDEVRLAAFGDEFPMIEWWFEPGEHRWPVDVLDAAIRWTEGATDRCRP